MTFCLVLPDGAQDKMQYIVYEAVRQRMVRKYDVSKERTVMLRDK